MEVTAVLLVCFYLWYRDFYFFYVFHQTLMHTVVYMCTCISFSLFWLFAVSHLQTQPETPQLVRLLILATHLKSYLQLMKIFFTLFTWL